jgi:hypothetical protein
MVTVAAATTLKAEVLRLVLLLHQSDGFVIRRAEFVLLDPPFSDHTPVHRAASHLIMDVDMKIKDNLDKQRL